MKVVCFAVMKKKQEALVLKQEDILNERTLFLCTLRQKCGTRALVVSCLVK